jgi:hypothetical protein
MCGCALAIVGFVAVACAGDTPTFEVDLARPIGGVWNEYANPGEDYPQSLGATLRANAGADSYSLEYRRNVYLTQSSGPGSETRYATLSGGYADVAPFLARDSELEARAMRRIRGPLAICRVAPAPEVAAARSGDAWVTRLLLLTAAMVLLVLLGLGGYWFLLNGALNDVHVGMVSPLSGSSPAGALAVMVAFAGGLAR